MMGCPRRRCSTDGWAHPRCASAAAASPAAPAWAPTLAEWEQQEEGGQERQEEAALQNIVRHKPVEEPAPQQRPLLLIHQGGGSTRILIYRRAIPLKSPPRSVFLIIVRLLCAVFSDGQSLGAVDWLLGEREGHVLRWVL